MKKILILLFTLAICQGNLFGQTDNNTYNRFLKAQYFGKVGGNTGSIIFTGTTSGNVTLKSADIAGTWSLTLPSTAGTANYPLLTNGSGVTSWGVLPIAGGGTGLSTLGTASQQLRVNAGATALEYFTPSGSGITVGTTTITSGTTLRIPYNLAGVYQEQANFTIGAIATGVLDVPVAYGIAGTRCFTHVAGNNAAALRIGSDGTQTSTSAQGIFIGNQTGANATGTAQIAIGFFAGRSFSSGTDNIAIGVGACGVNSTITASSTLVIGSNNAASWGNDVVSNDAVIGTNGVAGGYTNFYFGQGKTKASPSAITFNVTGGSGTDNAGSSSIDAAGRATGSGISGDLKHQTSVKSSTGTTLQPLGDRYTIAGKYVDLTAATATTFARVTVPTSTTTGGLLIVSVEANDGVDFQDRTFYVSWAAANKAGTTTVSLNTVHEVVASTSGTLTGTITIVDSGSGNVDFKMDAASSLAETTLMANFQVFKNFGSGTISAQ